MTLSQFYREINSLDTFGNLILCPYTMMQYNFDNTTRKITLANATEIFDIHEII